MKSRSMVVVLALLLAVGATAAVFLYVNAVKKDATTGGALVTVVVSTQDITAGTDLNPLIDQGAFKEINVPKDAVVTGAVTDVAQLRGQTATSAILANEQIPTSRLSGGEGLPGGTLGISPGHIAVTVQLNGPQGGAGNIQRGDELSIFASFSGVAFTGNGDLKTIMKAKPTTTTQPQQQQKQLPPFTLTLVPSVRVLSIVNPAVGQQGGNVTMTLDLLPPDAQNLIFAQQNGSLYVGLLPPKGEGVPIPASTYPIQLILGGKKPAP